ncbi:hypothetical protein STCU_06743 [Strigomonas culicis]|uniref:MYND-type domain-containing protein n=1 Tax=Strigomonas culicis TaxID=28005 RepID=S9VQK0_9TRYP|nr:hypothetical protein STCU_06743 [Strigomonas culicis]|eukprot:EPY25500.1 hypothetical protein STCU_06743 [Strigomonas culicis]
MTIAKYSQWHVVLRMAFLKDSIYVQHEAKIFSPTASLSTDAARGYNRLGELYRPVSEPLQVPIVPSYRPERRCFASLDSLGTAQSKVTGLALELWIRLDYMEAEVIGMRGPPFRHVDLRCIGHGSCGYYTGVVQVYAEGRPVSPFPPSTGVRWRFCLRTRVPKLCTYCTDPVYALGYGCQSCEMTNYCSRACMEGHMRDGHGMLCERLRTQYKKRGRAVVTAATADRIVYMLWWCGLENGEYNILFDGTSTMRCGIEFAVNTFMNVGEEGGLRYRLYKPKSGPYLELDPTMVVSLADLVLGQVVVDAVAQGCVSLASACLACLLQFAQKVDLALALHELFFRTFSYDEFDEVISSVEEFVSVTRPLYNMALMQKERAMASDLASEFWSYIKAAKDSLCSLCALLATNPCAELPEMRVVVVQQQVDTFYALARVFVVMASRAPQEEGRRCLEEAEKCLRQCLRVQDIREDHRLSATCCFRLSVLLLLFKEEEKTQESQRLKEKGESFLKAAREAKAIAGDDAAESSPNAQQSGEEKEEAA